MIKATLYTLQAFGTHKREIHFDAHAIVDWAQYQQVPAIRFMEKGKRTKKQMKADTKTPDWFLVEGWDQPEPPSSFEDLGGGMTQSIDACFGPKFKKQFESFCDDLKTRTTVIKDWRLQ